MDSNLKKTTRENQLHAMSAGDLLEKGVAFESNGQYQEAIEAYTLAIEEDISFGKAYYARGICHQKLGNYNRCLTDIKKAANLGHKSAQTYQVHHHNCPECGYVYSDLDRKCPVCGYRLQAKIRKSVNIKMGLWFVALVGLLLGAFLYDDFDQKKYQPAYQALKKIEHITEMRQHLPTDQTYKAYVKALNKATPVIEALQSKGERARQLKRIYVYYVEAETSWSSNINTSSASPSLAEHWKKAAILLNRYEHLAGSRFCFINEFLDLIIKKVKG